MKHTGAKWVPPSIWRASLSCVHCSLAAMVDALGRGLCCWWGHCRWFRVCGLGVLPVSWDEIRAKLCLPVPCVWMCLQSDVPVPSTPLFPFKGACALVYLPPLWVTIRLADSSDILPLMPVGCTSLTFSPMERRDFPFPRQGTGTEFMVEIPLSSGIPQLCTLKDGQGLILMSRIPAQPHVTILACA